MTKWREDSEGRAKLRKLRLGKKASAATKKKLSDSMRRRWAKLKEIEERAAQ